MGYHVTIRRGGDTGSDAIPLEEFRAACERLGAREFADGGGTARFDKRSTGLLSVFWQDGEVWTSNPDEEAMKTLYGLSSELKGRLVGDELETYREDGTSFVSLEDQEEHDQWKRESDKTEKKRKIWSVIRTSLLFVVITLLFLNKCVFTK